MFEYVCLFEYLSFDGICHWPVLKPTSRLTSRWPNI